MNQHKNQHKAPLITINQHRSPAVGSPVTTAQSPSAVLPICGFEVKGASGSGSGGTAAAPKAGDTRAIFGDGLS